MTDSEMVIACVEDYFNEVGVAALKIVAGSIQVGDVLHFKGHTTDLLQEISSMQRDHHPIKIARAGDVVGVKVLDRVREHDKVFKVFLED
ncbi:translation elongation factor-like protein [bacterium]|nr:translation elongation factor-like protein [bacterium]